MHSPTMDIDMQFSRKLRASFPIALAWGIAWGLYAMATDLYYMLRLHQVEGNFGTYSIASVLKDGATALTWGIIAGMVFVSLLVFAARGESVESLGRRRMALFGGLTGVLFALLIAAIRIAMGGHPSALDLIWNAAWAVGLGSASGVGMLWIARRGELPRAAPLLELEAQEGSAAS